MEQLLTFISNLINSRSWAWVLIFSFSSYGYIRDFFDLDEPLKIILAVAAGSAVYWLFSDIHKHAAKVDSKMSTNKRNKQLYKSLDALEKSLMAHALKRDTHQFIINGSIGATTLLKTEDPVVQSLLYKRAVTTVANVMNIDSSFWSYLCQHRKEVIAESSNLPNDLIMAKEHLSPNN